jgi:hypothetical protein
LLAVWHRLQPAQFSMAWSVLVVGWRDMLLSSRAVSGMITGCTAPRHRYGHSVLAAVQERCTGGGRGGAGGAARGGGAPPGRRAATGRAAWARRGPRDRPTGAAGPEELYLAALHASRWGSVPDALAAARALLTDGGPVEVCDYADLLLAQLLLVDDCPDPAADRLSVWLARPVCWRHNITCRRRARWVRASRGRWLRRCSSGCQTRSQA